MEAAGGCCCGAVRYRIAGAVLSRGMCLCRQCQHVAGGGANYALVVALPAFAYTAGEPVRFARADLEQPVVREFCGACGTHLAARSPRAAGAIIVKAGTLDDPSVYGLPDRAIFVGEMQACHAVPAGVPMLAAR